MNNNFNTRIYSDFDLDFIPHPLTGDIVMKYNDEAIKRAIRQLVLLDSYEKPFHPQIAGGVYQMLFEPMGRGTAISIESRLRFLITQFEKRCDIDDIIVDPNYTGDGYDITIIYKIVNQLDPIEQKIFLQRVR